MELIEKDLDFEEFEEFGGFFEWDELVDISKVSQKNFIFIFSYLFL
jgi:hypothetical protein